MKIGYNAVNDEDFTHGKALFSFKELAKILSVTGMGRNKILKLLREKGIFDQYNRPNEEYQNLGYFEVGGDYFGTPLVTIIGIDFIRRLL